MSNSNWTYDVVFTPDSAPAIGLFVQPDEGAYAVRCTSAEMVEGKNRLLLTLEVTEGDFKGSNIREGINLPDASTPADKARVFSAFIKGALVGLGHANAAGANGAKLSASMFVNRPGFVYYVPSEPGEKGSWSSTRFLQQDQYNKIKSGEFKTPTRAKKASTETPVTNFNVGEIAAPAAIVNGAPTSAPVTAAAAAGAFLS